MLNQIVLVGRLTRDMVVNKSDKGVKFKNSEGTYDTDFIECTAFDAIAENTCEYCSKGDIVGVKGRVQSRVVEKDDKKEYLTEIIAEKVTFLSSKKSDEEAEE